jgi:hypothetical protein
MMFCSAARQGGFRIFRSAHTGSPCRIRVLLVNCNKALEKRRVVADLRCVKRTGCMRSVGETSAAREYIYGVSQGSIEPRSGILDGACSRGGRGIRRLRRRHRRAIVVRAFTVVAEVATTPSIGAAAPTRCCGWCTRAWSSSAPRSSLRVRECTFHWWNGCVWSVDARGFPISPFQG